jgi:hypothetical protein
MVALRCDSGHGRAATAAMVALRCDSGVTVRVMRYEAIGATPVAGLGGRTQVGTGLGW